MLRGAVRPPISTSSTTTAASTTSFKMTSTANNSNTTHGNSGRNIKDSNEGKEIIIPLKRRQIFYRLDVLPFLLCYAVLILVDVVLLLTNDGNDGDDGSDGSWLVPIAIDVAYIVLLIIQLVLFLKCAWDPVWYAKVAYYWLNYDTTTNSSSSRSSSIGNSNGGNFNSEEEEVIQWKINQMKQWTHCLVIPPSPSYDNQDYNTTTVNNKTKKKRSNSSSQVVQSTERPGIAPVTIEHYVSGVGSGNGDEVTASIVAVIPSFRGWTYRCCCNVSSGSGSSSSTTTATVMSSTKKMKKVDVHTDLPMELIWYDDAGDAVGGNNAHGVLEEIDDDDIDNNVVDVDSSATTTITSTSNNNIVGWQPQFHRLHFPIDLPLSFYIHQWKGHTTEHSITQTQSIYGPNATYIPLPPYMSLLTEQLLQPLFLFQLFCVMLWSLDEYWIYALFTLGSIVLFECIQALNRWKGVKRLREEVVGTTDDDGDMMKTKTKEVVECYRLGGWMSVPTNELVAGDIISLISPSIHNQSNSNKRNANNIIRKKNVHDHERGNTIPADLLMLSGRAVVNEAMLTGESVPQVKESIAGEVPLNDDDGNSTTPKLDLSEGSTHKRCILFGGTVLMDHHADDEGVGASGSGRNNKIPSPPNDGIVCFVLRTGFDTIQGQLLRTMAYHAEGGGNNTGGSEGVNSKETFHFLLILLLCALISAASVLNEAWGDVTRNHFKLILHVIIIITSVIPPELPMELSLAVTTSLSELIKRFGVYCTEPFRIPLAGLVDTCCFDKTGTLTSDELRLHGVRLPSPQIVDNEKCGDDDDLILLDRNLVEKNHSSSDDNEGSSSDATIRSLLPHETLRVMIGCQSLAVTHAFVPGKDGRTMVTTELCGDPLEKAVLEGCGFTIHPSKNEIIEKGTPSTSPDGNYSVSILHRFAFSSKLRRMTTLAIETNASSGKATTIWALTKGAPEAIQSMIDPKSLPSDYEEAYLRHMKLGRRVLALAYRDLGNLNSLERWKSSRDKVEQNLQFAGLLIMDCPLKFDSKRVVKELRAGQQNVVMVTGDALLTAVEVARRVAIIDAPPEFTYSLSVTEGRDFVFRPIGHGLGKGEDNECLPYTVSTISKLRKKVDKGEAAVCITGDVLGKLAVCAIERASPEKSASVIDERTTLNHPAARTELALIAPLVSVFARHAPRHKEAVIAAFNASGAHTLMCGDGTNDVGALKQAHVGVSIISVPDLEAKQRSANETISAVRAEDKKERKSSKKHSKSKLSGKKSKQSRAERIERSLQALAEAEEELHYVSLGNASVASPFTSRKTSIRCCKDILQQGRCTLVTMIQIYKILGVNCLVNALVLTKLHEKGVKQGDRQLTAVGMVVAGLFLFVTRGKPLAKISPRKPPSSVLCKETILSMTVQFVIHFVAIMAVTYMSDVYVDPYDPSAMVPDGPFNPNTLNTATFLVTVLATINTFVVNYRGRPFMESLTENKLLFRSIQACYAVLFVCALDMFPPLNQLLQLSPLPSTGPPAFNVNVVGEIDGIQGLMIQAIDAIGFRLMLCVIMCLDTSFVTLAEKAIRSAIDG